MKKIISIVTILAVLLLSIFSINAYADTLDTIEITTDKATVHPGEDITINIDFGQDMGSYTADIAYDNNLLEFVSAEGGTENDNGTRIRVYFFDSSGGSNPRKTMSVTFKAKDEIITSNPTQLSVTFEGLANPDASVNYDDIAIPVTKDIIVEPVYTDYDFSLNYAGDIKVNEEKDMTLTLSSSMGKNYEHTRIITEVTTPEDGTVKLLATDNQDLEHDIIQSGWGDVAGDSIGGKDVKKEVNMRGTFSKAGKYTITFKLIDRDDSDNVITFKTFSLDVKEETTTTKNSASVNAKDSQKPTQNNRASTGSTTKRTSESAKRTTTKRQTTTQKQTTTKKPTTTRKPTTTKKSGLSKSDVEWVQSQANAYIKSKGISVDSSVQSFSYRTSSHNYTSKNDLLNTIKETIDFEYSECMSSGWNKVSMYVSISSDGNGDYWLIVKYG